MLIVLVSKWHMFTQELTRWWKIFIIHQSLFTSNFPQGDQLIGVGLLIWHQIEILQMLKIWILKLCISAKRLEMCRMFVHEHYLFYKFSLKLVNSRNQVTYKNKYPCIFQITIGNYHSMLLCIFSFLFIGQEPIMWPANKCLQLTACTFVILSKWCFKANNILLVCNNHFVTTLKWKMANCFPELSESDLNMKAYLVIEW